MADKFPRHSRALRGGGPKDDMMTRGREGVWIPPKNDDLIYEQPLIVACDDVGRHSDLEKR